MRQTLHIIGWTLCGLLLVAVAAVVLAIYVVFTPAHLTPVARQVASRFVTCQHEIGEVELTFFSTFPYFGVSVKDVVVINPMSGAPSDTTLAVPELLLSLKMPEALRGDIYIEKCRMTDAKVNLFIASDGKANYDVLALPESEDEPEDSTALWTLHSVGWDEDIAVTATALTFLDLRDSINASLTDAEITLAALHRDGCEGARLELRAEHINASFKGETYAEDMQLQLTLPALLAEGTERVVIDGTRLQINEFGLTVDGEVGSPCLASGEYNCNLTVRTGQWDIPSLLALVPARFTRAVDDLRLTGDARLAATVHGTYNGQSFPDVTVHELDAHVWHSAVKARGEITDLASDMWLDLQLDLNASLPDFKRFIPEGMTLTGQARGKAKAQARLSDITAMRLDKGRIQADLDLTSIRYSTDSMEAVLPSTHVCVQMPNTTPSRPRLNWARVEMQTEKVDFQMATPLRAALCSSAIQLEVSNLLSSDPMLYAAVGLQSGQPVELVMDSMAGTVDAPQLKAYVEYNTQDTIGLSVAQLSLGSNAVNGYFNDIKADIKASQIEAYVNGGRKVSAKLATEGLVAQMGEELFARTGTLSLEASSRYNSKGENALLKWNPRLKINLKDGELRLPQRLPETVHIPSIEFSYSNRKMDIQNSRVELGHSDLNLKGHVRNIGKWFRHKAVLEGQLDIVSDHCDANQLLAWFSEDDEEEQATADPAAKSEESEASPFIVPTDVDLALNTHIREVEIFNQVAKDLKGGLYVKNGEVIMDELGFICRAAKLQLTAIYASPYRDHLYVGLDYHMIDVDIDELLTMIPNLEEMVPMLSSFKGAAQFHLAAETYMDEKYQPKMSTLRGAASLTGKDLVVMDSKTFSQISKLLLFDKKTENKIDSINAEITVYKNEIDVYPLCVQMDNYIVAMGGRHRTDMTFDYDINVLKPIYLGVHVGGDLDNLSIKLAKCKYAKDFRPHWYQKADTQSLELRRMIKSSMEKNVRIQ